MARLLAVFLVVLAGTAGALPGMVNAAARSTSANVRRAREHYLAGKRAFEHKSYAKALKEFEEGYALEPRPGFLLNMGHAARRMGKLRDARDYYTRFLATHPDGSEERMARQMLDEIDREAPGEKAAHAASSPPPVAAPAVVEPPPAVIEPPRAAAAADSAPPAEAAPAASAAAVVVTPSSVPAHPAGPPPTILPSTRYAAASKPAPEPLDLRPRPAPSASSGTAAALTGTPSSASSGDSAQGPIYRRWWFWAGAGAVAVGVVTAIVVASSGGSSARADGSWGQLKL